MLFRLIGGSCGCRCRKERRLGELGRGKKGKRREQKKEGGGLGGKGKGKEENKKGDL